MVEESTWKRRFYLYLGARLAGLAIFFLGLAVLVTDLLRPGGWPAVGIVLIIAGLATSVAVPKLLRKQWQKEDSES